MSPHWQHNDPLRCPKGHEMGWLGLTYLVCGKCKQIFSQVLEKDGNSK